MDSVSRKANKQQLAEIAILLEQIEYAETATAIQSIASLIAEKDYLAAQSLFNNLPSTAYESFSKEIDDCETILSYVFYPNTNFVRLECLLDCIDGTRIYKGETFRVTMDVDSNATATHYSYTFDKPVAYLCKFVLFDQNENFSEPFFDSYNKNCTIKKASLDWTQEYYTIIENGIHTIYDNLGNALAFQVSEGHYDFTYHIVIKNPE